MTSAASPPVTGFLAEGFEPVAEVFHEVMAADGGAGSQVASYLDGRLVVALHGGWRDDKRSRPLCENTVLPIFSGTKGLVAICAALLVERGQLDLDAPVVRYWPEFGQAGKNAVLVRHVLSHQAGLPHIAEPVHYDDLYDEVAMAQRLERQAPLWPPGREVIYHALTFGWLVGEIIRRIDGRRVNRLLHEEVAVPLGAGVVLGGHQDPERAGEVWRHPAYRTNVFARDPARRPLLERIYSNPPVLTGEMLPWNLPRFRAAGLPGGGALASALGMARIYACLARGGELDGFRLLSPRTLAQFTALQAAGFDAATERPLAFGLGFEVQDVLGTYGPEPVAFGHSGAGGSLHGCWPRRRAAFSYTSTLMRTEGEDLRAKRLLAALHACTLTRPVTST